MRHKLNDKVYEFDQPIEAYAITRIGEEQFMLMTTVQEQAEEFDVNLYFSTEQVLEVARKIVKENNELGLFLLELTEEPFNYETATFQEIPNPDCITVLINLKARLLLEFEDEYKAMGNEFLPFTVTEIGRCRMKD